MSNEHRVTEEFNCYTLLIKPPSAKVSFDFIEQTTLHVFLKFHETMVTVHITVAREHIVIYVF